MFTNIFDYFNKYFNNFTFNYNELERFTYCYNNEIVSTIELLKRYEKKYGIYKIYDYLKDYWLTFDNSFELTDFLNFAILERNNFKDEIEFYIAL